MSMRIIEILPHSQQWAVKYEREASLLLKRLGNIIHNIQHIGSTSVPGLCAKPVIDILLETSNISELDAGEAIFVEMGYEPMGEFGIPRRRYYRKGGEDRTHHIHAFPINDPHVIRHIAFRDYLIAFPEIAFQYAALKKKVGETCDNNIDVYCDGKNDFIKYHERLAIEWFKNKKKSIGTMEVKKLTRS